MYENFVISTSICKKCWNVLRWVSYIYITQVHHESELHIFIFPVPVHWLTYVVKNAVFWDVVSCRYYINRHLGGTYHLHLQGRRKYKKSAHAGFSLANFSFFFYPEDGGEKFLQDVCLYNIYTAPHPRRWYSS
jgi:hypothetical protein